MTGPAGRAPRRAGPLTRRQRAWLLAVAAALAVLLAGAGVWTAVSPGSYGRSGGGCVNVTIPSSTGGAVLHKCGAGARALCRAAFAGTGRVVRLERPQCRLAGLGPPG